MAANLRIRTVLIALIMFQSGLSAAVYKLDGTIGGKYPIVIYCCPIKVDWRNDIWLGC